MSTITASDEDEWSEAFDATVPRVDLVGKSANGTPRFLLMKSSQGGLMAPDMIRDLIAKATPEATMTATILTGSPADVMAAIHAAPTTKENPMTRTASLTKADDAQDAADAVIGDDEPLPDADDLASSSAPSADGAGVPTDAPGDPDDVGSPAWEAVDAARARQALQLTIALQRLVAQSAEREVQEAAVGDDGDLSDVWTLEDVGCAIDAIVSMLAPFAITEQAEADQGAADVGDAMTKAARLIKAGRVLSSANEAKIRAASTALESVLGSLPAPIEAAPVAKETAMPTPQERHDAAHELLTKASSEEGWSITKGKGDPAMAVFDADGKLVGTIDPADLSPIAAPVAPDGGDTAAAPADPAPAADPEVAPVVAAADPAAAAPDEAVIPGTDTVAAPAPTPEDDKIAKAVQASMAATLTEVLDPIIKALGENVVNADLVKSLQERVDHLAAMPDDRKSPRLNGATGQSGIADRGGDGPNEQMAALTKAVADTAADPVKNLEARKALAFAAIKARFA
jgi:hypothetical protein